MEGSTFCTAGNDRFGSNTVIGPQWRKRMFAIVQFLS